MTDELKPCPFCGCQILYTGETEEGPVMCCRNCQASGPVLREGEPEVEHKNNWNERPVEDALRSRLAAAEKELAEVKDMLEDAVNQACSSDKGPGLMHHCYMSTWERIFSYLEERGRVEKVRGYYRWRPLPAPPEGDPS